MRKLRIKVKKFIWFFRFIKKYNQLKEERVHWIKVKIPSYREHIRRLERIINDQRSVNTELKEGNAEIRDICNSQRVQIEKLETSAKSYHQGINDTFIEEPTSNNESCKKHRCCTKPEAKDFAFQVGRRTKQHFTVYECDKCPKNKRTGKPYWHITHQEKWLRGIYGSANVQ